MTRAIDRLAGVLAAALAPRQAGPAGRGGPVAEDQSPGEARMAAPAAEGGPMAGQTRLDLLLRAMERLPRPLLALGALGLFLYAALDPAGFARRMADLEAVPDPLWWLAGAIMAFYFGTREPASRPPGGAAEPNAALDDWKAGGSDGGATGA